MSVDKIREERQLEGVDKWFKAKCVGTLYYATGVGKTYTALLVIDRIERQRKPMYLITVPSGEIAKQWIRQLEARYPKSTLGRILIKTKQELILNDVTYDVDVMIVDEGHEYAAEESYRVINGDLVKYKALLVLTASADDKNFGKIARFAPVIDTITEQEAKDKGFIAEFTEYNIALSLTADEQSRYDKYSDIISEELPKFNNNLSIAQLCISGGEDPKSGLYYAGSNWALGVASKKGWHKNLDLSLETDYQIDQDWNPRNLVQAAIRVMRCVRLRKDLLNNCEAKVTTTVALIKKFNNVKMIIFSESTSFADKIHELVVGTEKSVIYHSNLRTVIRPSEKTGKPIKVGKTRLKREAVDAIRSGLARVAITSRALDKGANFIDLRMSVTASGTQNPTQYKQRGGRVKRRELGIFADCMVLLVNLYIKETQDEKWLKSRQANILHKVIDVNDIADITYTPPANVEYTEITDDSN